MFVWKLLVCVVVLFVVADCDVGVLTEHNGEGIDPVDHHEGEDKEQSKRTVFDSNYGWAKHVRLNGKQKLVLGYSPVDLKYVPVVKPLVMRRPGGWRFKPRRQKRPRPVYQVPVKLDNGGWKPLMPAHVPAPPNSAVKPWQQQGWHSTRLVPSKPFKPSAVDHHVHHDIHTEHHDQNQQGGHVLVQDAHSHVDLHHHVATQPHVDLHHHVATQPHVDLHHHVATQPHVDVHHAVSHPHIDLQHHALAHPHVDLHQHAIIPQDLHVHQDIVPLDHHLHVTPVVQPNPVVIHYDTPSIHVDKPALPVLPLGATFPLPVLQQPIQPHQHFIPQPNNVPVIPELPHGHVFSQYPGVYQIQGTPQYHVPHINEVTRLHPVPQVPQTPHLDIPVATPIPQAPHFHQVPSVAVPGIHLHAQLPGPQVHHIPDVTHLHQIPQVHHYPEVPQVPQVHHYPEVPQHPIPQVPLHQVPQVHQIPQVPHFLHQNPEVHQIPQFPHVHQIPQVPHVHQVPQIPEVPHVHQTPQVPHFHQIPSVHPIQPPSINQLPPFEAPGVQQIPSNIHPVQVPNINQLPPIHNPVFNQHPQEEPRIQHTPQIPQIPAHVPQTPQPGYLPAQHNSNLQDIPQNQINQVAIEYHGKGAYSIPLEHLFRNNQQQEQQNNQYDLAAEQYQQQQSGYQQENIDFAAQQQEEFEQSNQVFPSGNGLHPGYTDLQLPIHLPQHPNLISTDPQTFPNGIVQPALALEPPYKK